MYDRILVPTDGSEGAERAAAHAIAIGERFEATIDVVYVIDTRAFSVDLADIDDIVTTQVEELEDHGRAASDRIADRVEAAGLEVETSLTRGIPYRAIPDYADEHDIDLIAMGTHGRTGLDRALLGSVTERVIRTAVKPVLAVRGATPDPAGYDDILVPTDGSEEADAAREHALALADRFDARVHVLNVVDIATLASYADGPIPQGIVDDMYEDGEAVVAEVAATLEAAGIDTVEAVLEGNPARSIREYVDEHGIDLIAMGTRGRSGIGRFLLGSVAERTARTAPVPVLTVRRQ